MSDPVANVDIEDVLSSIRRLVSGDSEKDDEATRRARDGERLVLTPSQRVDAADDDGTATEAESSGVTQPHPPEIEQPQTVAPDAWAGTVADGTDTETETDIETESVFGNLAPEVAEEPVDVAADVVPEMAGFGGDDALDDALDDAGDEVGDDADDALDGIAAMFARHEAATPSAWEPDGDDEDAFADGADAPALDWRDASGTDEDIADTGDGRGPDRSGDRTATLDHDRDADAPDDEENAFAIEDEAVLDEEALRDLVAEIVREELMGTLGERITRNVRKLVRREIHRALNSQDFD